MLTSSYASTVSIYFLPPTETDPASGIDSNTNYLCALSFGGRTNPIIVNGLTFQRVHLNGQDTGSGIDTLKFNGIDSSHGGTWSIAEQSENRCRFVDTDFDTLNGQADGAIAALLSSAGSVVGTDMNQLSDRTVTIDLGGLRPGTKYSLRYYYCQWADSPMINFSFSGENKDDNYTGNPLNLGTEGAAYLKYDFIAATNHVVMRMKINEPGKVLRLSAITLQKIPDDTNISAAPVASKLNPNYGVGSWILEIICNSELISREFRQTPNHRR